MLGLPHQAKPKGFEAIRHIVRVQDASRHTWNTITKGWHSIQEHLFQYGLEAPSSKWDTPPRVVEILWDQIQMDKLLVVVDKQRNKAVVLHVATPSHSNIRKEHNKIKKYQGLREKLADEGNSDPCGNWSTSGSDPKRHLKVLATAQTSRTSLVSTVSTITQIVCDSRYQ